MCPGECKRGDCNPTTRCCMRCFLVLISTLFNTPNSLLLYAAVSARDDVRCMQLSCGECTQVSRCL